MTIYVEVVFVLSDVEVDKECKKIWDSKGESYNYPWCELSNFLNAWARECFKAGYKKGLKEARK